MDEPLKRIAINPDVMFGKPVIKGTRITVAHIVRDLASGWTEEELIDAHPHLTRDDIRAALVYAAERLADERFLTDGD